MYKIFLIIFVLKSVSTVSDDESYEKYIDLLPEKEKQEFLDRIARRLMEEIQTDAVPDHSNVEINDDQLESHDKLIQTILKEETENLKDEKIKYLRTADTDDTRNEVRHIDLTFRDSKRQKRKNGIPNSQMETATLADYNVIPVKIIRDEINDDEKELIESEKDGAGTLQKFKQNISNKSSIENIQSSDYSNNTNVSSKIEQDLEQNTDENGTVTNNNDVTTSIQPETQNNRNVTDDVVIESNKNVNNNNLNASNENMELSTIQNKNITTILTNQTTSAEIQQSKNTSIVENRKQNQIIFSDRHKSSPASDIDIQIEHLSQENTTEGENVEETEISTTKDDIISVRKIEHVTEINVKQKGRVSKEKMRETKTALRLGPNSDNKILKNHSKVREYEVYEVASEKTPFRTRNYKNVNTQPNYVPIHDYASDNAYFRPYDRFGPENDEIKVDTANDEYTDKDPSFEIDANIKLMVPRSRFVGYNNQKDRSMRIDNYNSRHKSKSNYYELMKPAHRNPNVLYNPYDYMDMDYVHVLRKTDNHLPNSNEPDHSYNSIQKSDSVKDHIRAARKLLYLLNRFGYVPTANEKGKSNKHLITPTKVTYTRQKRPTNIAADYYFGRINSNENLKQYDYSNSDESVNVDFVESELKIIADEKRFHAFFNDMLQVIENMVRFDDGALDQYSWFITTLDIRSAIKKILDLSQNIIHGKEVHLKDAELLKYCLYLYESSKVMLQNVPKKKSDYRFRTVKNRDTTRKNRGLLPHNRNKRIIKRPLKLWQDYAKFIRKDELKEPKFSMLIDFEYFLQNLLFNLNEFHDAIKHIAMVTKYENQNWFKDLKQIYFDGANKTQLAKVILHINLVDLLDNIEEDAINKADANFKMFLEENQAAVGKAQKNFIFVMRVLEEMKRMK